jgi:hypothetical protein
MEKIMNKIPENIMKPHDPNDDPFAALSDDTNQLVSPLEFGSGISYFVSEDAGKEEQVSSKKEEDHKEEYIESSSHDESSNDEDVDEDVKVTKVNDDDVNKED